MCGNMSPLAGLQRGSPQLYPTAITVGDMLSPLARLRGSQTPISIPIPRIPSLAPQAERGSRGEAVLPLAAGEGARDRQRGVLSKGKELLTSNYLLSNICPVPDPRRLFMTVLSTLSVVPSVAPALDRPRRKIRESMNNPIQIRTLSFGLCQSVQEWNKPTGKSLKTGGRNLPRGTNPPMTRRNPSKNAGVTKMRTPKEFFLACGKVCKQLKIIEVGTEQTQNKPTVEADSKRKSLIKKQIVTSSAIYKVSRLQSTAYDRFLALLAETNPF